MEKAIADLSQHLIICGSGATATYTAAEIRSVQRPVLFVCDDAEGLDRVQRELPDIPILVGDPTSDDVLMTAGVERAAGLVASTQSDKDNILVTLSARQLNPRLRIVCRVTEVDAERKARKAGANAVVSPSYIGGLRLASELLRPTVVSFLDQMLRDREVNLRIDELRIPEGSPAVGRRIEELAIAQDDGGALLLACRTDGGDWTYNPPGRTEVTSGLVLVLMGSPAQMRALSDRLEAEMVSKPT